MFDDLVRELSDRYGLGDRSRDLFGLLMGYIYNDRRGGFGGFAESFRQQGHGDLFASWLGGEPRRQRPLSISEVGMVFGQGLLSEWGNRIGASRATVATAIAGILPRLIGELTPGGRLPEAFGSVAAPIGERDDDGFDAPPVGDAGGITPRPVAREVAAGLRREAHAPMTGAADDNLAMRFQRPVEETPLPRHGGRVEPLSTPAPIDPHVAAIAAAVANAPPTEPGFASELGDFEFRRPMAARRRRGFGWLLWLLILLVLAAGGWFYWQQGQSLGGVQLPWSTTPAAN
ncbi:uncharacterized protein DUF937 [Luteimonas cucumeris]|uniref:Uncharacterized protein DUF937 n=1 Tax=Luteimonas cucumeris TaxID=985012 RepID=A0A562L5G4_9GAMM|nr:YidB family protein [Luteimonas cucumeris]TWI02863.1 uncharacterized protein DUF937 [Luteimonas cucumeris]